MKLKHTVKLKYMLSGVAMVAVTFANPVHAEDITGAGATFPFPDRKSVV